MTFSERLRIAVKRARSALRKAEERYYALNFTGKALVWLWVFLHLAGFLVIVIVTPTRLFALMAEWAEGLREMYLGWLLLLGLIVVSQRVLCQKMNKLTSIPPMFGYGTCITLCGFAFGVWQGWLIASAGCLLGGIISFLTIRQLLRFFLPMLKSHKVFSALGTAVKAKGLPLVILIRLCPFPFPYSNAFFASIESVTFLQFFFATLTITPKLFLHVWVGSRMFLFADPESRGKMDTHTKIVNGVYVAVGTILGVLTSTYLYRLTMQYVTETMVEEEEEEDLEAGLIDNVDELLADNIIRGPQSSNPSSDSLLLTARPTTLSQKNVSFQNPSMITQSSAAPKKSQTVFDEAGRASEEDQWGLSFSDMEDDEEGRGELTHPVNERKDSSTPSGS